MCWVPIPKAPKVAVPKSDTCKHSADRVERERKREKDERNTTDVSRKQSLPNY